MKQTVVFDFDGVINSYKSGWQGLTHITDEPVEGIREAIASIREAGYEVIVVSTRCADYHGKCAVIDYLKEHEIKVDDVRAEKPPAVVYIDDRAICFDGNAGSLLERIRNFQPWNKRKMTKHDHIKSLDVKVFAKKLAKCNACEFCKLYPGQTCSNITCEQGIMQYLTSEEENDA